MNKLRVNVYVALASAALFSILSVSFSGDISLLAFPLAAVFTGILIWAAVFRLIRKNDAKMISAVRKLFQYEPFVLLAVFVLRRAGKNGTSYGYDVVTVLLWCIAFIFSLVVQYFLSEKRVYSLSEEWAAEHKKNPKPVLKGGKRVAFEIIDWADALVQAVFMVLLIQIFIVQLYVIPSESMVPEFLIKDRVIVFKTASGPKFPLSDVGVPCMKKYKRGNIVVFRNPHYSMDRRSEVKTVVSQLVYMLTFTGVNLNVDGTGQPKADPLVKRICGVPGEQLVMQDGTLYVRTKGSEEFKASETDAKYAAWDLNAVSSDLKNRIQLFPLAEDQYKMMISCEEQRRSVDIKKTADECRALASRFAKLVPQTKKSGNSSGISLFEYDLFVNNISLARRLLSASDGKDWFNSFMTDWIADADKAESSDVYTRANFRLNVMIKLCVGNLVVRNAELFARGVKEEDLQTDSQIQQYMKQAEMLNMYVMILDQRNMPVFPADNTDGMHQYIPDGNYFMMGDNRFNSLDMRHSYSQNLVNLTALDPVSVKYYSNMAPQYVSRRMILGTTTFRFWPLDRIGTMK